MSATIEHGSFRMEETREGATAEHTVICDWSERGSYVPQIGTPLPGRTDMRLVRVEMTGIGKPTTPTQHATWVEGEYGFTKARIVLHYSTAQFIDDAAVEDWEFGGEVLELGLGRTWGIGVPCEVQQTAFFPQIVLRKQLVLPKAMVPRSAILYTLNKVNSTAFEGFPAETLLFAGASTTSRYDYERQLYFVTLSYNIIYRPISHNYVWRAPKQALSSDGVTPMVDNDGYPVWVSGAAGVGGWDYLTPPLHESTTFEPLFPPFPPPVLATSSIASLVTPTSDWSKR